jgi:hypothetical protein
MNRSSAARSLAVLFTTVLGCTRSNTAPTAPVSVSHALASHEGSDASATSIERDVITPDAHGTIADDAATASSLTVTFSSDGTENACVLRASAGGVVASCRMGALACAERLRGELAPAPGDERVVLCTPDAAGGATQFLVLATESAVLWAKNIDGSTPGASDGTADGAPSNCMVPPTLAIELVDVLDDAPRELLVRATECTEPGAERRWDTLYQWRDGALRDIHTSEFNCSSTANTSGVGPVNFRGFQCGGGYLVLAPTPRSNTVVETGCEDCRVPNLRGPQTIPPRSRQSRTLRWNPATHRLAP